MRILSIGHSEDGGGAQTVFRLSNQISDDNLEVITAFKPNEKSIPDIELDNLDSKKNFLSKVMGYFYIYKNQKNIKSFLENNNVDIIHIHNSATLGIMLLPLINKMKKDAKIVYTSHGYGLTCPIYSNFNFKSQTVCSKCAFQKEFQVVKDSCDRRGRSVSILRYLDFKLKKFVTKNYMIYDSVIVPSNYLEKILRESKYTLNDVKVVENPLPAFSNNFNENVNKKDLITFIGRFSEEKNILLLLVAYKKLLNDESSYKLKIIGDGELRKSILLKIGELGLEEKVILSSTFLPQDEVQKELRESKFLILPTKSPETFGLVIFEGIIAGNIPIVSDIGAQNENVNSLGFGFTFKNNDVDSLVRTMREAILNYKVETLKLEQSLPILKKKYSIEIYKEKLKSIYSDLCKEKEG